MAEIEIEIDGRKLAAQPNQMVIQVADAAGVYIPRFCYHKHLSIAANCRMCLVEVEKSPKPLPACATPVTPGMKVFTKSPKAIAAQRAVMEFLLINHPLDCPICDQGGECELQDLTMGYGSPFSHFIEGKRAVKDEDLGPLIATEMTRCIHCTRCVRFGDEVAGTRELGATHRGGHMQIQTYIGEAMRSEVSGNIIDLCPVGALTSKPFRFRARAWELAQASSISPHDCVGSHLYVHTRTGKVMRVVAQEHAVTNETWISDRDRFSYEGLYHHDRFAEPLVRINGELQVTDWHTALTAAAEGLRRITETYGSDQVGALASPNSTIEEFYLLQKMVRELGSQNIDYRLRQTDFSDQAELPVFLGLNMSIADLENCDAILLVGSHIQKEQPLASLRVRKATRKDAVVMAVNMFDFHFNFPLQTKKIVSPAKMVAALASIVKALHDLDTDSSIDPAIASLSLDNDPEAVTMAKLLKEKSNACVLLGALAANHPQAAQIRRLAQLIANLSGAKIAYLTEGANAAGAALAGAVPHRTVAGHPIAHPGLDAAAMFSQPRKGYILFNVEPKLDCANPVQAEKALKQAEFVVALATYNNSTLSEHADVVLPLAAFTETPGTFVNAAGEWQHFQAVAALWEQSRPGWEIIQMLARAMHLADFDAANCVLVREKIQSQVHSLSAPTWVEKQKLHWDFSAKPGLFRIGDVPIYAGDSLVRRSEPLQAAQPLLEGESAVMRIHPEQAQNLGLQDGDMVRVKQPESEFVRIPAVFDKKVPMDAVFIAAAVAETAGLTELFGLVEVSLDA